MIDINNIPIMKNLKLYEGDKIPEYIYVKNEYYLRMDCIEIPILKKSNIKIPEQRKRTLKERLFSWPWKPLKKYEFIDLIPEKFYIQTIRYNKICVRDILRMREDIYQRE